MKYLKRFNEELNRETLLSAAKKATSYRHIKKAMKFLSHAYLSEIKRYGSIFADIEYEYEDSFTLTGEFYPFIEFSEESGLEKVYMNDDLFKLEFNFYVFPKSDEYLDIIIKSSKSIIKDLYSEDKLQAFYMGKIRIYYDIPNPNDSIMKKDSTSESKFGFKYILLDFLPYRKIVLKDKRSATSLKKNILGCFEQGSLYPTTDNSYQNSYDQIKHFLNKSGFTLEYDYTIEDIYDDIYSYSSNKFYIE